MNATIVGVDGQHTGFQTISRFVYDSGVIARTVPGQWLLVYPDGSFDLNLSGGRIISLFVNPLTCAYHQVIKATLAQIANGTGRYFLATGFFALTVNVNGFLSRGPGAFCNVGLQPAYSVTTVVGNGQLALI